MNKQTFFTALFLLFSLSIFAQQKNHIKIDPFLPVFGTFQLGYEREIHPKMSVGLEIGFKTSSGVFEVPNISTDKITTENFSFKGIKLIPEFRWYLSPNDKGMSGFYTGAYYKYQNYTMPLKGVYTDNSRVNFDVAFDTKLMSNTVGLEIGYKLMIKKRFFADFIIAGPGVSFNKLSLTEKTPIPQGFYDDLADAIDNYPILQNLDLNTNFSSSEINKTTTITLPAFRYGVKIGYSF